MKVATIVGARPQFIKASVVSAAFARHGVDERIIHTGQHFDANMSDVFFDELQIPRPHLHLGIGGGTHGQNTGRMIEAIEAALTEMAPDWVLVYGDTDSTLAAAIAASKLHIPLAHVEAGLRSFNKRMPEEINRILTDHCASLLFTPTAAATQTLLTEGMRPEGIVECGDVMLDAALHFGARVAELGQGAARHGLVPGGYVLATVHRQENTDDTARLSAILDGLGQVAQTLPVLLPMHPRTRARIKVAHLFDKLERLCLTEPLGYLDMVGLERDAAVIATDSGGMQKEAFFHKVPCITLRDETEWSELITAGWNTLVPPQNGPMIAAAILAARGRFGEDMAPYGTGDAAEMVVRSLLDATR
ncbi:UDP-N-acetylglucosamine 2-epimerase (non-hydrolyzing) [Roseovarius sp. LXJ103]|uniref:non-hydrolyzing UDP-N-acetylglucosamine 2-epimerase n=1 Tax=Roseovarius carneus TaxID=2853164 RepID=UPI000D608F8D|nr:UDP-N-acetylglucosamine 2-epimerase (non-hydrolyzing) [Roseovarius carneus]MBZ8117579.1 UDP-N-acetylglucosamine 2-epimerase (non-hydrolyzing) [Roseovarius carneus]PWE36630.1 UDP-N-acetylglucosamine 2-epimerase (non-hydrolyzing) [Pelagicola sp. LXJ1103]